MSHFFPTAFEERMKLRLLSEWDAFEKIHQTPSPVSIRINPKKNPSQPSEEQIPWTQYGYYLKERPVFTLDPSFHAGTYYVQEASSMFLEQALKQSVDLTQSLRVLDLCAAPGGKSTHLLSLISDDSLLISNEVIRSRASILSENIQKWGNSNVLVTNSDPEVFQKLEGYFDVMVIDAPCSGEGLFRKDAEAMNEWSPDNVALCSQRQQRILSDVWPALKENGILIYCTCTYSEEENENNLSWLAAEHNAEFIELSLDPSWKIETIKKGKAVGYRFYPHKVNGEGFFISVIRKVSEQQPIRTKGKKVFQPAPRKTVELFENWMLQPEAFRIIQQDDLLIQIPLQWYEELEFLCRQLHIVSKGTALAEVKHDK
ncbi:MAG TPA: RsmB/NOP family class I SAM-dependent RNA methyltransferase, partial [Cyclobacteriaceae bacterium]